MYRNIIEILKCPICGQSISLKTIFKEENDELIDAQVMCNHNHLFAIKDGVLDFNSMEQNEYNNWSKMYEENDYASIDKMIEEGMPKNQYELNQQAITYISQFLNQEKPNTIVDIASGRGMLATKLANQLTYNPTIICTDLSFEVLKYDRIKINHNNSNLKMNFIACDCTNIPIKDQSIECSVSFYGIANMMEYIFEGIKETHRILTNKGRLLNAFITIEKNNKTLSVLEKFQHDFNQVELEPIVFKENIYKMHQNVFDKTQEVLIGSSVGEYNKFDLIPIEGEEFSIIIYDCKK